MVAPGPRATKGPPLFVDETLDSGHRPPFGFHLWSATYDRDLRDVLDVQTDVARQIGKALALELLRD